MNLTPQEVEEERRRKRERDLDEYEAVQVSAETYAQLLISFETNLAQVTHDMAAMRERTEKLVDESTAATTELQSALETMNQDGFEGFDPEDKQAIENWIDTIRENRIAFREDVVEARASVMALQEHYNRLSPSDRENYDLQIDSLNAELESYRETLRLLNMQAAVAEEIERRLAEGEDLTPDLTSQVMSAEELEGEIAAIRSSLGAQRDDALAHRDAIQRQTMSELQEMRLNGDHQLAAIAQQSYQLGKTQCTSETTHRDDLIRQHGYTPPMSNISGIFNGASLDEMQEERNAAYEAVLDQMVDDGVITEAEADFVVRADEISNDFEAAGALHASYTAQAQRFSAQLSSLTPPATTSGAPQQGRSVRSNSR